AAKSISLPADERLFPVRQALDRHLSPQRGALIGLSLPIDQPYRTPRPGVARGGPLVVLAAAAAHVLGDPGVERTIRTAQGVHEPAVCGRCWFVKRVRAAWCSFLPLPRHLR